MNSLLAFITSLLFFSPLIADESLSSASYQSQGSPEKICSPSECYTIIQTLGEGVFGRVYSVIDSNGHSFAIKTHKLTEAQGALNFYTDGEREFLRGQILNHPNIIKTHDFFVTNAFTDKENAHIVLDLVKGETIFKTKRGSLQALQAIKAAIEFVDAVSYGLSIDLMHLDLHGGNVMLDDQSNIKVIDLASFFTLDEILSFHADPTHENDTEEESTTSNYTAYANVSSYHKTLLKSPSEIVSEAPRIAKLKHIMARNPKLLKAVKKIQEEKNALTKQPRLLKSVSLMTNSTDSAQIDISPIQLHFFDRLTDVCVALILKSDMPREEKIHLRSEIKKICWNYEEDVSAEMKPSVHHYLDRLTTLFHSLGSH
jgi:hypothetical protein